MAVKVSDVRTETQIPASLISDDDVIYVIGRVAEDNLFGVCAYVCRLLLRKYRGRTKIKIGRGTETIDYKELRAMIVSYQSQSGDTIDDGYEFVDSFFTRDGI
jgi:hypothetical protein